MWEMNSEEKQEKESSVSSLFYYSVSLWRNPPIHSTDPGFYCGPPPWESLNQAICQRHERFAAPGFTVK